MIVLSKKINTDSAYIKKLKEKLKANKLLEVVNNSENNIDVFPKYKTSFPFTSKRKSTMNYYYKFSFEKNSIKINYVLQNQIYYALIFEIFSMIVLSVLLFFSLKSIGLLIISIMAFILSIIFMFTSLVKAKLFLEKVILDS